MADRLPEGPYRQVPLDDGASMPWYMIPFDRSGRCEGPRTREELLRRVGDEGFTDIFLFSHGWNNDWTVATGRYAHFLDGFADMRRRLRLDVGRPWRPLMVGVFWPSAILVGADEQAPLIAGGGDTAVAEERREVAELAGALPDDDVPRFYELTQHETLDEGESLELAGIVRSLYAADRDEIADDEAPSPHQIVAAWEATAETAAEARGGSAAALSDFGTVDAGASGLASAGLLDRFRPRDIVRMLTVWQMKDRAGTVGAHGVAPLLVDLLGADDAARVHLIGHSYGAKVVLSALCYPDELPRNAASALLLQPAVSHLCFADRVAGVDRPGGYHDAPRRVDRPILSTFSEHDFPLTRTFHLALRRKDDRGDQRIAAPGEPPSVHAALGGFGPRGLGDRAAQIPVKATGDHYELSDGAPDVYGVEASATIGGHGDISNESTWWALYDLVRS